MTFDDQLNEAYRLARERSFVGKENAELQVLLGVVSHYFQSHRDETAKLAIQAIEHELSRRQRENVKLAAENQIQETQSLHRSVQQLKKPHWTQTPSFGWR